MRSGNNDNESAMIKQILVIAYKDENGINRNIKFDQLSDTKQKMISEILTARTDCKHEHEIRRLSSCGLTEIYYCADCFVRLRTQKLNEEV